MKKFLTVALAGVLAASMLFTGCSKKEESKVPDKLIVGTNAEFPPFEYMNDKKQPDGFDIAMIKEIGKRMYLDGLKVTILVSVIAILIGVALGTILALMRLTAEQKGKSTLLSKIAYVYIDIIRGTPTLTQLMIMYFVILKGQNGLLVGSLTFGLNSAAYVAEIIRAGIQAVDQGQMEGGRSLGLSYVQTMKDIILPLAIKNILPALGNEFIVLIKETSILGYVAIVDLTKVSDFVISRIFEALAPLLGTALIYYVIVKILTLGLNALERRLRQSDRR